MSTQAISSAHSQAPSKKLSFWERWRQPRILTIDASELLQSPVVPDCHRWKADGFKNGAPDGGVHIARVARWNGTPAGGAILTIRDRTSFVRLLHVDAAWRGRGIGRRLLQSLLRRARQQLVRDVYALATVDEAGFYALHGFRPTHEEEDLPDKQKRFVPTTSTPPELEKGAHALLRRRLTTGLVSVPYDGITVKM